MVHGLRYLGNLFKEEAPCPDDAIRCSIGSGCTSDFPMGFVAFGVIQKGKSEIDSEAIAGIYGRVETREP